MTTVPGLRYRPRSMERTCRLDLRLTVAEKQILQDVSKSTGRTMNDIISQLIDEIDKIIK